MSFRHGFCRAAACNPGFEAKTLMHLQSVVCPDVILNLTLATCRLAQPPAIYTVTIHMDSVTIANKSKH
jgi:hypothetical protein